MSPLIELIMPPAAVFIGAAGMYLVQRGQVKLLSKQLEQRDRLVMECAVREQKALEGFMAKIGIHTSFNEEAPRTIDRSPKRLAELVSNERKREANAEQWEQAGREYDPSNEGDDDEGK